MGGLVFQHLAKTNTTHHLYYDGNGNVTSLRSDAGSVSAAYEYGPFGETLTARGDADALASNAFGFSTKYADETGLYYYGYRYYNPGTGRWLNRDPIEEAGGVGMFSMVANSPIARVDALGLILIAVDGTSSRTSLPQISYLSHVYRFYATSNDPRRRFFHGPRLDGQGVKVTIETFYDYVCEQLRRSPDAHVDVVGHSRGGLIVALVAKKLNDEPCNCGTEATPVRFLGLYDAADMYAGDSADLVSGNVEYVAHARRDPHVHSRPSWGNAATSGGKQYEESLFWVTHAGAGGGPWTGDHPIRVVISPVLFDPLGPNSRFHYEPAITKAQDKANSIEVDRWMRRKAASRRVLLGLRSNYYQEP